jgi:glycerol-3-phosphate cytidylyltransferase
MKRGFTCGAFDLLHAGHYMMFREAKEHCDHLTVLLQTDPNIDRPEKNKPIESIEERKIKLMACRYIDDIIEYETEADLFSLIDESDFDIRIIGMDHKGKPFTGDSLISKSMEVYYNTRDHPYSTTNLRKRVYEAEKLKWDHLA